MRPTASVGLPPPSPSAPRQPPGLLQLGTFPTARDLLTCSRLFLGPRSPLPPPNVMSLPSLPSLSHWVLSGNRRHLPTPAPTPTHIISVPSFFVLFGPIVSSNLTLPHPPCLLCPRHPGISFIAPACPGVPGPRPFHRPFLRPETSSAGPAHSTSSGAGERPRLRPALPSQLGAASHGRISLSCIAFH